jgi:hypothetical protein
VKGSAVLAIVVLAMLACTARGQVIETIELGSLSYFGQGCRADLPTADALPAGEPQTMQRIDARPRFDAIIRDACTWDKIWAQHVSGRMPFHLPPTVDFDPYDVVAVVAVPRATPDHAIEIARIEQRSDLTLIHIRVWVPATVVSEAHESSNPYHFVQVAKAAMPLELPVAFSHQRLARPQSESAGTRIRLPEQDFEPCTLIDFDRAEIIHGVVNGSTILSVTGMMPCGTYSVEVVGCVYDEPCYLALAPSAATLDLDESMEGAMLEIIGATRADVVDLASAN